MLIMPFKLWYKIRLFDYEIDLFKNIFYSKIIYLPVHYTHHFLLH